MSAVVAGPAPPEIDYEARLKELEAHPLFMRDLPDDVHANERLEALQSLIYDDTPDNIAGGFKQQGNDYFRGKRYREALGFYNQAIDAKPDDKALLESLFLNRAACNLELHNYGSTLRDCAAAIKLNAKGSKAYYRSARALMALERLDEALDCCRRCLTFDAANVSINHLVPDIEQRMAKQRQLLAEKERKVKEAKSQNDLIELACAARHLTIAVTPTSDKPGYPEFDPEESKPYTPRTQILFPVFFLYPQHSTSDFISHFAEHTTFKDHLAAIFPIDGPPPSWDREDCQYRSGALAVYAVTRHGRLLRIPSKSTLAGVFLQAGTMVEAADGKKVQDGMEIRDGCLSFVVVPKGDVENWYVEDFRGKKLTGAR